MDKVTCKFKVHWKEEYRDKEGKLTGAVVKMSPVYGESGENKAFFNATPSGEINLYSVNQVVAEVIQQGEEYYIDIHK